MIKQHCCDSFKPSMSFRISKELCLVLLRMPGPQECQRKKNQPPGHSSMFIIVSAHLRQMRTTGRWPRVAKAHTLLEMFWGEKPSSVCWQCVARRLRPCGGRTYPSVAHAHRVFACPSQPQRRCALVGICSWIAMLFSPAYKNH